MFENLAARYYAKKEKRKKKKGRPRYGSLVRGGGRKDKNYSRRRITAGWLIPRLEPTKEQTLRQISSKRGKLRMICGPIDERT